MSQFTRLQLACVALLLFGALAVRQHQAFARLPAATGATAAASTTTTTTAAAAAAAAERTERPSFAAGSTTTTKLHLRLGPTGLPEIPGLYDERDRYIVPIQGKAEFQQRVLGLAGTGSTAIGANEASANESLANACPTSAEKINEAGKSQTISLVQFYMATCPDCQGFSPYFKRFAQDIGPHWHKLVSIYVVNCNDHQNIHLCQEENPRLVVPMVRWYVLPIIQADSASHKSRATTATAATTSTHTNSSSSSSLSSAFACPSLGYPRALLNVAHRQFIEKQRRDLISLRRATLRLVALMLDELSNDSHRVALRHNLRGHQLGLAPSGGSQEPRRRLFEALAVHWHHQAQLGRDQPEELSPAAQFYRDLESRVAALNQSQAALKHFVIFESRHSFVGRTVVADWSAYVGAALGNSSHSRAHFTSMMVHRTSDLSLLPIFNVSRVWPSSSLASDDAAGAGAGAHFLVTFELLQQTTASAANQTVASERSAEAALRRRLANVKLLLSHTELEGWQEHGANGTALARNARSPRAERRNQRAYYLSPSRRHVGPTERRASHHLWRRRRRRRDIAAAPENSTLSLQEKTTTTTAAAAAEQLLRSQAERDNANWTPESVFPHEEEARFRCNRRIAQELGLALVWNASERLTGSQGPPLMPGSLLAGGNPGEIARDAHANSTRATVSVVPAKADDLTLMFLTDYYKGLDELLHTDLMSKGDLDGYQLLASCCFLRDLKRHFPFQGNAHGSGPATGVNSKARLYVQLVQQAWLAELKRHLLLGNETTTAAGSVGSHADHSDGGGGPARRKLARLLDRLQSNYIERDDDNDEAACPKLDQLGEQLERMNEIPRKGARGGAAAAAAANGTIAAKMELLRVPIGRLESLQSEIKRQHDVGLPSEKKLKWNYCAGSGPYLRGHTCSLWVLFHTLTVSELLHNAPALASDGASANSSSSSSSSSSSQLDNQEYSFQIDFSKKPSRFCDPKSPDDAYLASRTSELHVNETQFVLANIINFVRYYLPCTNCAAHFSCMVNHSPGLSFKPATLAADSHLLWLWEGHNRVNERTRGTHSEDPARPKHVFPSHEACPQCYLKAPASDKTPLDERKFNRRELVKFIVARYRKSAILNNKINIELLYRDT